ncbi:MAG: hypothetical protein R2710_06535 [Acidimicrobiales bacterium]
MSAFNWEPERNSPGNTKMTSSVIEPGEIKTSIWDKAEATIAEFEAPPGLDEHAGPLRLSARQPARLRRRGQVEGIDPDRVAPAVEHALTASRPKARHLVGPDAKGAGVIARLRPGAGSTDHARRQAVERAGRRR